MLVRKAVPSGVSFALARAVDDPAFATSKGVMVQQQGGNKIGVLPWLD